MKLKVMLLVLSVLFLNSTHVMAADETEIKEPEVTEENVVKVCPICGPEENMVGKEEFSYEFEGKTYWFCSQQCLDEFKKSPEKYTKVSEENHEGDAGHEGHNHDSDHDDHSDHKDDESHEGHDHK